MADVNAQGNPVVFFDVSIGLKNGKSGVDLFLLKKRWEFVAARRLNHFSSPALFDDARAQWAE